MDPDHITITPLGSEFDRLLDTKAVVAICVLLVPLAAVGAVATPDKVEVPLTDNDDSVPREVTLGCAGVLSVPLIFPVTERDASVPNDVILGCDGV
jgi:hypothetical protein